MMDIIERLVCKWLIKRIKEGYGADCPDVDENVLADGGCFSCKAKLAIQFLENHINL